MTRKELFYFQREFCWIFEHDVWMHLVNKVSYCTELYHKWTNGLQNYHHFTL